MRRGFTLIELLVVMGILGLLIGLIAPGLASARDTARSSGCAVQLHELGVLQFDQSWERDRWCASAYDLTVDRFTTVADRSDYGYTGRSGSMQLPPGGSSDFARKVYDAEKTAPAQPPSWRIPCPEAKKAGEQSYGMNWRIHSVKPERVTATDLVFGDSPYRLVVRGLDLARRHQNMVNFMYGDQHVALGGPELLTQDDRRRLTWREAPVPAEYPER